MIASMGTARGPRERRSRSFPRRTGVLEAQRQSDMATINDTIRQLVTGLAGETVCDDCIADRLALSVRTQANQVTRLLAGETTFDRRKNPCALCGATKLVIRAS